MIEVEVPKPVRTLPRIHAPSRTARHGTGGAATIGRPSRRRGRRVDLDPRADHIEPMVHRAHTEVVDLSLLRPYLAQQGRLGRILQPEAHDRLPAVLHPPHRMHRDVYPALLLKRAQQMVQGSVNDCRQRQGATGSPPPCMARPCYQLMMADDAWSFMPAPTFRVPPFP